MTAINAKTACVYADAAFIHDQDWFEDMEECYDYVLPYRGPSSKAKPRKSRLSKLFDSTAPLAITRAAGRLQRDLTPPFQQFFTLELGPVGAVANEDDRKQQEVLLEHLAKMAHATIDVGEWHNASAEMFLDYLAGEGALVMPEGDDDMPCRFISVPVTEVATEDDGTGFRHRIHWRRREAAKNLIQRYPDASWPEDVRKAAQERVSREFEFTQTSYWDRDARIWRHISYVKAGRDTVAVKTGQSRTNIWLLPRYFRVPGENRGRGPGQFVVPDTRVANKTVELLLRAAALAITGIWTKTPGPSFNGNMANVAPGKILNVQRNGGALGKTLERLDTPGDFNISQIILEEMRGRIREALHDRNLPPEAGPVRSASEVVERLKFYAEDLQAAFGRQTSEIVVPLVRRVLEVLYNKGLISTNIPIDQLLVRVRIVSPLADAQAVQEIQRITDWLMMIQSFLGEEGLILAAKMEDLGEHLGRLRGVPEKLMRSDGERVTLQEMAAKIVAAREQGQESNGQSTGSPAG
jgi:hypothetical protein